MTQTIKFGGLTCSACQKILQKRISKIQGVESVEVSNEGITQVTSPRLLPKSELIKALEGTEYKILEI